MIRKVFVTATVLSIVWSAAALWAVADEEYQADDFMLGSEAYFASQPAPSLSTDEARSAQSRTSRSSSRSSYNRQSRAPNMFGDVLSSAGQLSFSQGNSGAFITDVPLAGGRNQKVGENNKPIPMDRVYFVYNGFQNAVTSGVGSPPTFSDSNLNRYTFGFEKTFLDGRNSLDVRMPLTDDLSFNDPFFGFNSGNVGNLALFYKHLCFSTDTLAVAAGVGCTLPTGSDVKGQIFGQPFRLRNDAVHVLPYVGFLSTPNDLWFLQGFLAMDFAANGNTVFAGNDPSVNSGRLTEQNLLQVDLSAGRWLYQNGNATYLTGVAGVCELHYTSTVQNADTVPFMNLPGGFNLPISNPANRTDVLNLTCGLQFQIGDLSNLRVGCVVPLRNAPDRQFDSEIQVSFNRFF